jgi:serine kinase of HPr protein (carbohydrate metabolism regulator)
MANVHASAIVLGRHGVLLRGPSGAGKSLLAAEGLVLVQSLGLHAGWIGDDRVELEPAGNALIARPAVNLAGRAELRFSGIQAVTHIAAARIDLVADLVLTEELERLPESIDPVQVEGITLPRLALPREDRPHALAMIVQYLLPRNGIIAS